MRLCGILLFEPGFMGLSLITRIKKIMVITVDQDNPGSASYVFFEISVVICVHLRIKKMVVFAPNRHNPGSPVSTIVYQISNINRHYCRIKHCTSSDVTTILFSKYYLLQAPVCSTILLNTLKNNCWNYVLQYPPNILLFLNDSIFFSSSWCLA